MLNDLTSLWAIALTRELGVGVDQPTEEADCRQRVTEVDTKDAADQIDNTVEVGHSSGKHEGNGPVDGSKGEPHPTALLGGDWGELEDFLEHLNIHCLHTDVEVEDCKDLIS